MGKLSVAPFTTAISSTALRNARLLIKRLRDDVGHRIVALLQLPGHGGAVGIETGDEPRAVAA